MTLSRLLSVMSELGKPTTDPARVLRWAHNELRGSWPQILQFEPCGEVDPESGEALAIRVTVTFPDGKSISKVFEDAKGPAAFRCRGGDLGNWLSIHRDLTDALDEWLEWHRIEPGGAGALDTVAEPPSGRKTLTADEVTRLLLGQMDDGLSFKTIRACVDRINKRGGRTTTRTTVLKAIEGDTQLCIWAGRRPANPSGKASTARAATRPEKPLVDILSSGEAEARRVVSQSSLEYGSETDRQAYADWFEGMTPEQRAEWADVAKPLSREPAQRLPDDVPQRMQVARSCTETPESIEEIE